MIGLSAVILLLIITLVSLFCKMDKIDKFKFLKEKKTLIKTVITFVASNLFRIINILLFHYGCFKYKDIGATWTIQIEILLTVVCEVLPCMLFLMQHWKNVIKSRELEDQQMMEMRMMHSNSVSSRPVSDATVVFRFNVPFSDRD